MAHMISGIGNPIVAVYARCYLCRVGRGVSNRIKNKQYLLQNFHRFLNSYHHVSGHATNNFISDRNSSSSAAASRPNSPSKRCPCRCTRPCSPQPWTTCCRRWRTTLPTPSSTTSRRSARITATGTPRPVPSRHSPPSFSSLILNTMMSAFKPSCISKRALQFMEMMEQCLDQGIPLYSLLANPGPVRERGAPAAGPPPANLERGVAPHNGLERSGRVRGVRRALDPLRRQVLFGRRRGWRRRYTTQLCFSTARSTRSWPTSSSTSHRTGATSSTTPS
jgi:hypothetical protein